MAKRGDNLRAMTREQRSANGKKGAKVLTERGTRRKFDAESGRLASEKKWDNAARKAPNVEWVVGVPS